MRARDRQTLVGRAELAVIGAVAGLAMWLLIEVAEEVITNPHLFLTVTGGVAGFFAVLLALCGPARLGPAALAAAALAGPAGLLLGWSSLRFDTLDAFISAGHPLMAWSVILFIGTPFLAARLEYPRGFRDYESLFDSAWGIVVRYSAAWLFVGVFWAVVFLSDALLQIVGVSVIEDLLDIDAVPHVMSGLVLGLGLAVVYELRDYVSPYLLLRLLRLLVPVMLGVVLVFVLAFVLRGAGDVFGDLSPAATLLAVATGMISLVSVALDKRDSDSVKLGWMRWATALLALLVPVLVGLAAYAIWLRVSEYGWTPPRLSAAVFAGFIAVYGLCYALSVLLQGLWMERIRQSNIGIAAAAMLAAALWLSPVLNAEAISSNSQVARIERGAVTPENSALWELAHEWGRPGRAALARLSQDQAANEALQQAIARARSSEGRYSFEGGDIPTALRGGALGDLVQVVPAEARPADTIWNSLPDYRLDEWLPLCRRESDPGCVLVLDEFDPSSPGLEGLLFLPGRANGFDIMSLRLDGDRIYLGRFLDEAQGVSAALVRQVLDGGFSVAPSSRNSLWIGETELFPVQ